MIILKNFQHEHDFSWIINNVNWFRGGKDYQIHEFPMNDCRPIMVHLLQKGFM